ncbi:phage tail protein [Chengkuizengella axinellae]|uniref:Phage tail protein n=1 Tax=Chengkuizengella axinellae TaxID=3064388 RepID=A0ABT9IYB9_9BACL|nr:phage tail protein [Chengkuizengella sp. 2205SS18-9]MDP5274361.1 phage tail protein [Chengkuizengella sp. 2205SS18-9]
MDSDKYLIVLDRQEKPLGYLTKAINVEVRERLNQEVLLSFEIPLDDDETNHLEHEGYITCESKKYIIKSIEPSSNQSTRYQVQCTHVYIEMLDEYIDRTIELIPGTCQEAAEEILLDSEFTLSHVDVSGSKDIEISEISVLKALQNIREKWDCDLWFNNRNVYLGKKGINKGVEIRYGKNLKALRSPSSSNDVITRLYIYGQDGLTIESENNGLKYIDSPNIGLYRKPKIASVKLNDITDPVELLEEGAKYLRKHDTIQVSYQVDFVELAKQGYEGEDIELGDELTLTHLPLNLQTIGARVVEYVRYPFAPKLGYITLSSFVESTIDDYVSLKKRQGSFEEYSDKRNVEYSETKKKVDNGEIYIKDKYGQVVVNEEGLNLEEIAGFGIIQGGTISIENRSQEPVITTTVTSTNNNVFNDEILTLADTSGLPESYSGKDYFIRIPIDEDFYIEPHDRVFSGGIIGRLTENFFVTWTGKNGNKLTGAKIYWQSIFDSSHTLRLTRIRSGLTFSKFVRPRADVVVSDMAVIMPNQSKHVIQGKRFDNQLFGCGMYDFDGWEYRKLYVNSDLEIKYESEGTSGGGLEYPSNPPDGSLRLGYMLVGYGFESPDGDLSIEKTYNSDGSPAFKERIYHDNRYRDERLIRASDNELAFGGTPYGSEIINVNTSNYQTYYINLGKGKRSASVSITRTDGSEFDNYSYGANLVIGRKAANNADNLGRSIWGTYVDSSGNAGQVTGRRQDNYTQYILDSKVFGKSYTYLYDADLMPHPEEPETISLKLTFYNRSSSSTENFDLKITWHAL